jgi:hypothetical protein
MNTLKKSQNEPLQPPNLAYKIAAIHGAKPKRMRVRMVGSSDVQKFVSRIEKARKRNLLVPLSLD